MSEILVLAAHDGESVKKVTLELLTLARRFGEPAAVWLGSGAGGARERLAEYGATKVYVAEGDEMTDYVAAPAAEVLAALVAQASPAAVLVPSTAEGKEVAGGSRSRSVPVCSPTRSTSARPTAPRSRSSPSSVARSS